MTSHLVAAVLLLVSAGQVHLMEVGRDTRGWEQCQLQVRDRQDCGWGSITPRECAERGCCWQPCHGCDRVPWCFMSGDMHQPQCMVANEHKEDCGYYGIGIHECVRRGCCWAPSNIPNTPWCFNTRVTTTVRPTTTTIRTTTEYGMEGEMRLMDGDSPESGRLEVYHDGRWGTVCDDGFGEDDAQAVCRMLGLSGGNVVEVGTFPGGSGPIWLDEVECGSMESTIGDCSHQGWGSHDCSHPEDVGINCGGVTPPPDEGCPGADGNVRLAGGEETSETLSGRVEIFHSGQWGSVCDDGFDDNEAQVVCRQLNYQNGSFIYGSYGSSPDSIWLDDLMCSSEEESLLECDHLPWGEHNCDHSEDAAVQCYGPLSEPAAEGELRLTDGCQTGPVPIGRLEIYHNGEWGTICDDAFGDVDAQVACSQMGYPDGALYPLQNAGSGTIWMDEVECSGTESSLSDCSHNGWANHDCSHPEDVAIQCLSEEAETEGDVRLAEGISTSVSLSGRLEIYHDGEWGTVCDDDISCLAETVCNQLGFAYGSESFDHPLGGGQIWMDQVNCCGADYLVECSQNGWGSNDCSHSEDVGITCTDPFITVPTPTGSTGPYSVRLSPPGSDQGRIEIEVDGEWGTVCDDMWDDLDATVACRQMGFESGIGIQTFGGGSGPIWMDSVECAGDETALSECSFGGWGDHDCSHYEDAGVICEANSIEGSGEEGSGEEGSGEEGSGEDGVDEEGSGDGFPIGGGSSGTFYWAN